MLSEGWKCPFKEPFFEKVPRGAFPQIPLGARACGTCHAPPPPLITLNLLRHYDTYFIPKLLTVRRDAVLAVTETQDNIAFKKAVNIVTCY